MLSRETRSVSGQRRQFLHLAMASVAAALFPACRNNGMSVPSTGDPFPEMDLRGLDGARVEVPHGVPILVNFWATWCEPCRREMPALEKLSKLFAPQELTVIGISVDSDTNLAREFILSQKLSFPMLSDGAQSLSQVGLRLTVFPTTYLLRRDRSIADIITGARDWTEAAMLRHIEELLALPVRQANAQYQRTRGVAV